jgi:hypothetical protein
MIAMDVVDTLRHDKRILERELNDDSRRADLIERLRAIYKGQGIEVPDRILEEGVKALEEKRFAYTPPPPSAQVSLAKLYVSRGTWGRKAAGIGIAALLAGGGWYLAVERPRSLEQASLQQELGTALPARITNLLGQIEREARVESIRAEAQQLGAAARSAASGGDVGAARTAEAKLKGILDELRLAFDVRILNRQGEVSGLWRVPRINPGSRNYYLVVEAVEPGGKTIVRDILNEETGERERVTKWAIRVPKSVFDEIQADKLDDGIIQKAVLGSKPQGYTEPQWRREVSGGALTRW